MYTDDNLRICDDDYEKLKDKYSIIYTRLNSVYDAYWNCLINVAELAFPGNSATHNNLAQLSKSIKSIEFDNIQELSTLYEEYIQDIDEADSVLYDDSKK